MNNFLLGMMGLGRVHFFFAPDPGSPAGGGSGDPAPDPGKGKEPTVADLMKKIEALEKKNSGGGGDPTPKPDPQPDPGLNDKVIADRKAKEKRAADDQALETALKFTLKSDTFLKENETILPKTAAEIFVAAEKEKYDSPVAKANAIKSALIVEFFNIQANVDNLTPAQKMAVEDFQKLTKNGREERAQHIFENIFEPALELTKRIKKAEEISRAKNGFGSATDAEKAYRERMQTFSRKHYLNEKETN